jgi:hypothetical protein
MHAAARSIGCIPYVVSPSQRETDCQGTRYYYQLNDLVQQVKNDPITNKHCIVMTDIDYYVGWDDWMSYDRPALIYTFVPESTGGTVEDGVFYIEDDVVTTIVSGGGTYQHGLWNYHSDSLWTPVRPKTWFWWTVDIIGRAVGFWEYMEIVCMSVDHFQMGKDRRIISLVPFARCPKFVWNNPGNMMQPMRITTTVNGKKFNRMRIL